MTWGWLKCIARFSSLGCSIVFVMAIAIKTTFAETQHFTQDAQTADKFGVHEVVLIGDGTVANPFDTIATVRFTPPSGAANAKTVWAFYDGENSWRARVYISEVGDWQWSSTCESDQRLNGQFGRFHSQASALRGRLLIDPQNPRQWITEDGHWFLNLNDTSYFLLCSHDGDGKPIADEVVHAYVKDATEHGITSLRSFIANGSKPFIGAGNSDSHRWNDLFADNEMTRIDLEHLRVADRRLRWLLNNHPEVYLQFILFPLGKPWRSDEVFWTRLSASQRERLMRQMIARFAAYPQIFWLIVNDAHFGSETIQPRSTDRQSTVRVIEFPNSCSMVREVGAFFGKHDPWRHPISAGPARTAAFHFDREEWATYIHLEDSYDLAAQRFEQYQALNKPVFLGEDRYEQDHPQTYDPRDMRYFQRRLFWAWLLSGGTANYGGRWWVLHPYSQTGQRPAQSIHHKEFIFEKQLTGLDSVRAIRDFFQDRHIELTQFQPDHSLVFDLDGVSKTGAPKLMRRGDKEFLIYHPNAATDRRDTRSDTNRTVHMSLDMKAASGNFSVEWYRAEDGHSLRGGSIQAGRDIELTSPWRGYDVIVRLVRQ